MRPKRLLLAALLLASTAPAIAQEPGTEAPDGIPAARADPRPQDPAFDITVTLDAVSDYVSLRGFSQTDRDPALQGTFDLRLYDLHAGFFVANVDFGTAEPRYEIDPYIAWRPSAGSWDFDVTAWYYAYVDDPDLNYPEVFFSAAYDFPDLATLGGTFALAPNYFGEAAETGLFYRADLTVPLGEEWAFSGTFGYQDYDAGLFDRHLVWDAGLTWNVQDWASLDLRYHDTDLDPASQCAGPAFQCSATVVATLSLRQSLAQLRRR